MNKIVCTNTTAIIQIVIQCSYNPAKWNLKKWMSPQKKNPK